MVKRQFVLILSGLIGILLFVSVPFGIAWAGPAEIEKEIKRVMADRHPTDTPEWWRALGPDAPSVILSMLKKTQTPYGQVRLTEALGWFSDSPEALAYLKSTVVEVTNGAIRNSALKSIGASAGQRELPFVAEFLTHADPQTRLTAAQVLRTLQNSGSAEAGQRLEQYLRTEKLPWISEKLAGRPSVPATRLEPVSTSEDSPAKLWVGGWVGGMMVPASPTAGLNWIPAEVNILAQAGKIPVRARMTFKKKVYDLDVRELRVRQIEGSFPKLGDWAQVNALSWSGEAVRKGQEIYLEIVADYPVGARLILRKTK